MLFRSLDPEERRPRVWAWTCAAAIGTGLLLKGLIAAVFPVAAAFFFLLFTKKLLDRETWRRRLTVTAESGALDPPGTTWRDRPSGDRGDDVHVVGDMVAAPGLLSEVTHQSAVDAVTRLAAERPISVVAQA